MAYARIDALDPLPSPAELRRIAAERAAHRPDLALRLTNPTEKAASLESLAPLSKKDTYKSATEAEYALRLEARRRAGEIRAWQYEERTFVVGIARSFTPDFRIVHLERCIEYVEIKNTRSAPNARDSITRLHTAAMLYPRYRFTLARRSGSEWTHRRIGVAP